MNAQNYEVYGSLTVRNNPQTMSHACNFLKEPATVRNKN